jgi:Trp operon repressor
MGKLTYLESYFAQLAQKYNQENNQELKNEFLFNASEKGSLYARYRLLNELKK